MRKLHKLLMAALVIAPLTACDEGNDTITPAPPAPAIGTVSGTVAVEGSGVAGITVQLAGASAASTTTGSNGSYSFANVVEGNYSVTISGISGDYAFATTSQTVTVNTNGQTVSADFNGSWVRTASVLVNVERADGQGVATTVTLAGEGATQSLGTNAQGTVTFSGLKKGAYTVTIPAIEGFATTSSSVTLNTGQAAQVNFVGERELLPPEVSIASITDADGNAAIDQTPGNITGPINVTLNVRPNGNTLTSIELWKLNKSTGTIYRIGNQRFATTAGPLAAGEDVAEVVFNAGPAATYRRDGSHPAVQVLGDDGFEALGADATRPYHPIWVDGNYELHGVVTIAESTDTYNAIVDVTVNSIANASEALIADGFRSDHSILRVETDNTDWEDPVSEEYFPNSLIKSTDGLLWHSGDVIVDAYPVMFSAPYNPNDPSIARMTLSLDAIAGGEKVFADDDFNADGSVSWTFCEGTVPNAGGVAADCDASVAGILDADMDAAVTTVTKFGQPGFNTELTWFEDLFSGTDDVLRLDNDAPTAATIAADDAASAKAGQLPHPGNLVGTFTTEFSRTQLSGANNLGWVKHSDVLDPIVVDAGISDGAGIGLPATAATRPSLIYVAGPDVVAATVNTVAKTIAAATVSGLTISGDDLPAETDEAYLVSIGSAAGSPFSDAETDYQLAARNWDLFGNWVNSSNYVTLGVDNLAPIFTNAAGVATAPVDPTLYKDPSTDPAAGVYNTFGDQWDFPDTLATSATYGVNVGNQPKEAGSFRGYVSDSGNGFAGIAGLVAQRWENANGTVATGAQYFYTAETAAEPEGFKFEGAALGGNTWATQPWWSNAGAVDNTDKRDGYRSQRIHTWDRAGNALASAVATENNVDRTVPTVNALSVPAGPFAHNTAYSWSANVSDTVDLKKGHAGFQYSVSSIAAYNAALNVAPGTGATSFFLPVQNTSFSAFGSAEIIRSGSITLTSVIPCLVRFDEAKYVAAVNPTHAFVEVFDHASTYGLTHSATTAVTPAACPAAVATAVDALVPSPKAATAGAFIFQVSAAGKPQIVLSGPTSVFSPTIDLDDVNLYYLDRAGRATLMVTSAADWSLNVTDAGAGVLGRKYTYTFTGTLPAAASRVPAAVLSKLAGNNGTESGYFMTLSVGGALLIWDDTVTP